MPREEELSSGSDGAGVSEETEETVAYEDMGEEDEGEDLFGQNYARDYEANEELDRYDLEDIGDSDEIAPLTRRQLEAAEREIDETLGFETATQTCDGAEEDGGSTEEDESEEIEDFDALQRSLDRKEFREKLKQSVVRFLRDFDGRKYSNQVRQMASLNMQALYVDYFDLAKHNEVIALAAVSLPVKVLPLLNEALHAVVVGMFPRYTQIRPVLIFRLVNTPSCEKIRDLRNSHLDTLVKVVGIVTRRSSVFPLLSLVKYNCQKCKAVVGPFLVESEVLKPNRCLECQGLGPFTVNTAETIYKDFQKVTIQEVPGTVPPGRLPRSKEVIALFDLIDHVKPGDEVELVGVYRNNFSNSLNLRSGSPVFFTSIEAVSITRRGDDSALFSLTAEDEQDIREMAKRPDLLSAITASIAPSIHGHFEAKRAITLALFGGEAKHSDGKHRVRGDINVLLLGDPGMAKTQLLKYIEKTSHRAVFSTGQGASAVGLTAMVRKDPVTREWTLEGGALVLADKGVCLIDEFDKMKDTDRVSIHEAMEQQSISISKAGIVTSLQARCAVIAAANPIRGRYNPSYSFSQNVNLTDPIISRFDIICVIRDEEDREYDEALAQFIVGSHSRCLADARQTELDENNSRAKGISREGAISQDMLRKYIVFARQKIHPKIEHMDIERVSSLYASLRRESASAGGIPITVRHVESIVRIAEASARMHLRENVLRQDIDLAIAVVLDSFCGTQKAMVRRVLRRKFERYLPGAHEEDSAILDVLCDMLRRTEVHMQQTKENPLEARVKVSDFRRKALSLGISLGEFLASKTFSRSRCALSPCGEYIMLRRQ